MNKKQVLRQGDKVKLLPPRRERVPLCTGLGADPGGIRVVRDGEHAFLPYNKLFQVSEHVKAKIANMDSKPLPLIRADFLSESKLKHRFKIIEPANKQNQNDDE